MCNYGMKYPPDDESSRGMLIPVKQCIYILSDKDFWVFLSIKNAMIPTGT